MAEKTKLNTDFERVLDYDPGNLNSSTLKNLYRNLLYPRVVEDKMLIALRKGRISKWFSGIGQEAIAVGSAMALRNEEFILPLIRNLGVFTTRGVPLRNLFAQFQGKVTGFTKGRDRSFHFGTPAHNIVGMISHLGPQMAVADGIGLAEKLSNTGNLTLVFTGDGGTNEGDFHEALNLASVWDLPVLFLIENNGYALSTPVNEQYRCNYLSERAQGYGMKGLTIDGNNILEVYQTIRALGEEIRETQRPVLLECMTFRMRGHEEASGTKYVPQELMDKWAKRDPVYNYQTWCMEQGVVTEEEVQKIRGEIEEDIEQSLSTSEKDPFPNGDMEEELKDVYAPWEPYASKSETNLPNDRNFLISPNSGNAREMRFIEAISSALWQSMEKYPELIQMGQDIAEYGSVFKVTEGFVDHFGKDRIRNTPLCESAIIGSGLGLSVKNFKSVIEMQFADFVTTGFNQIVNNLAKVHYRWHQNADVVIRMPTGAGVGAGPFHSQSTEAWFFKTPGLKIAYPSDPIDAKGLLNSLIEDPNPSLFFEHKMLYRSIKAEAFEDYYTIELGKGRRVREGDDLTIITYGAGVHWALETLENLGEVSAEVIDLRTLMPWDREIVYESVRKTNKALLFHEDTMTGSIGAEIAASITEDCFEFLDGPVKRVASLDTPVPFSGNLEEVFLPKGRLKEAIESLLRF